MIEYLKNSFTFQNIKKSVLTLSMITLCMVVPPMIFLFGTIWIMKKIRQEEEEEETKQYSINVEIVE